MYFSYVQALNTFIDDIFAFVIKMPTMYRIGCFRFVPVNIFIRFVSFLCRDDIVFFIFLYQRYIYKEDPTRVNEFGYSAEMLEDNAGAEVAEIETQSGAIEDKSEDAELVPSSHMIVVMVHVLI